MRLMTTKSMSTTEPSTATSSASAKNFVKSIMTSMRSKRFTASDIDTTRRNPPASAHRGLWSSRLVRLIFAWNFVGFAILTLGVLLLSELREQLIQAKVDALATQGELVANVL